MATKKNEAVQSASTGKDDAAAVAYSFSEWEQFSTDERPISFFPIEIAVLDEDGEPTGETRLETEDEASLRNWSAFCEIAREGKSAYSAKAAAAKKKGAIPDFDAMARKALLTDVSKEEDAFDTFLSEMWADLSDSLAFLRAAEVARLWADHLQYIGGLTFEQELKKLRAANPAGALELELHALREHTERSVATAKRLEPFVGPAGVGYEYANFKGRSVIGPKVVSSAYEVFTFNATWSYGMDAESLEEAGEMGIADFVCDYLLPTAGVTARGIKISDLVSALEAVNKDWRKAEETTSCEIVGVHVLVSMKAKK